MGLNVSAILGMAAFRACSDVGVKHERAFKEISRMSVFFFPVHMQ